MTSAAVRDAIRIAVVIVVTEQIVEEQVGGVSRFDPASWF